MSAKLIITILGALMIFLINLYFFSSKRKTSAEESRVHEFKN